MAYNLDNQYAIQYVIMKVSTFFDLNFPFEIIDSKRGFISEVHDKGRLGNKSRDYSDSLLIFTIVYITKIN